jgi:ER-bound oxygenase mpaB/B'/Rubber oxygenase, catalytic domain
VERGNSAHHVRAVVAIEDRVLRNYWVTQSYSDLASRLAAALGADTANWCTFATWASGTVGRNLRGEDLPDWLHRRVVRSDGMMGSVRQFNDGLQKDHLDLGIHRIRPQHLTEFVADLFGACATNLSDGNTEVFAEIAPAAAVFIEGFERDPHDIPSLRVKVLRACEGAPEFEGVNRLQVGFAHWCDALAETDPIRRSQLILAGSLELGAHEQHHLQGPIAGSMDMGLNQSFDRLKGRLVAGLSTPPAIEESIDALLHPLGEGISAIWGDLMTELLGTIHLPDRVLRLNRDVPPLPGQEFVPPDLEPVVVDDLGSLLERFDRAKQDGEGSRAMDWVNLDERMNFITNLFRSRHHCQQLFQTPFDAAELAQIEKNRIPGHSGPPIRRGSTGADAPPAPIRTKRRHPPSKGVHLFTDGLVETLRVTGDPPADAAVAEFFHVTGAKHSDLFRNLASRSAHGTDDEDLPGIGAFARQEEAWPEWADPELVREGQRVFGEYGTQIGMGLFMASLPSDYAFANGVQALARTTRLTRDPKRRYVETGQMIIDVMTPGALEPGASGYRTVRHTRLMHAAVRHVLQHVDEIEQLGPSPVEPWDEKLGLPISQLQLLGTLFSFSVEGIQSLRKSGVRLSNDQSEAYIHVWNLVGHQIGIRDDLLPLSWKDSTALWDRRRRSEYGPTPEGVELTEAAIECMQELFSFSHLPGLPAAGIRHYLGNRTADMLGVPKADWTRVIFELMRRTDSLYQFALIRIPGTGPIASELGRRIWHGFELYGRDGDRPAFRVTDELKDAWGMST